MSEKKLVILGAGKLGKGYMVNMAKKAGYKPIFLARRQEQVDFLRKQGYYTVYVTHEDGSGIEEEVRSGFEIYCIHGEEREQCLQILEKESMVMLPIYANGFEEAAKLLGEAIIRRAALPDAGYFNAVFVVNYTGADKVFDEAIRKMLTTPEQIAYFEKYVGLVTAIAQCGGFAPTAEQYEKDPESFSASDYDDLPIDADTFKGEVPLELGLRPLNKMDARAMAKIWTSNMNGGAIGGMGKYKGYVMYGEATDDPAVMEFAARCMDEAMYGIEFGLGLNKEEFEAGQRKKIKLVPGAKKRVTIDVIDRQLFGLIRKLGREERFLGPALGCMLNGRLPYNLAKAAAYAFRFDNPKDPDSVAVLAYVAENGIEAAVYQYCGLDKSQPLEKMLAELICGLYQDM